MVVGGAVGDIAPPFAHHPNVQFVILGDQVELGGFPDVGVYPRFFSEFPPECRLWAFACLHGAPGEAKRFSAADPRAFTIGSRSARGLRRTAT